METKRLLCALLCVLLALGSVTGTAFAGEIPAAEPAQEEYFTQWNAEAPALNALVDYVETVTDPESPDFIPEMDRIAVFDMDGTLIAIRTPRCWRWAGCCGTAPWTTPFPRIWRCATPCRQPGLTRA